MTREKAIEILKYNSNVIHKTMTGETDTNEVEALDMAIEALEKINKFQTTYNRVLSAKKVEDVEDLDGDELMLALAGILGCEPRVKAKWILASKKGTVDPWWCRFKCSNCGITTSKFNYCPNCGAEMQGVEEQ